MGFSWTDNAATSSTRIRAVHINELRSAVDQLRTSPPCSSLGPYPWTDNPITTSTHVRAVHFTELRSAIQDLWTCHGFGSLPNWSVGNAPSTRRQVSARDINDLRGWVNKVAPTLALNGLHWQRPLDLSHDGARTQVNLSPGFGSILILSHSFWNPPGPQDYSAAESDISWFLGNRVCTTGGTPAAEAVVARLYFPKGQGLPGFPNDPGQLAQQWAPFVQWCQSVGVYNFVVLNEPDNEYPNWLWDPTTGQVPANAATYMAGLADALRAQASPGQNLWLGFPGPSGNIPPRNSDGSVNQTWVNYWTGYRGTILAKYNNVTAHLYGASDAALESTASAVYGDLTGWFPNYPIRYTEYGIPLNSPSVNGNRATRAAMYANFVNWVRQNQPGVFACYVFIARDSPGFDCGGAYDCPNQQGQPQNCCYMLSDTEAQTISQSVGCVGQ